MKKLMMGTAIALFATGAAAQEWSMDVGGFFDAGLGYVDIDDEFDGQNFHIVRDSEIIFIARLVADNGITFGARTELEGAPDGDDAESVIDENFLFVTGSFGRFELGEGDGAKDRYHYLAYVNGPWTSAGDGVGFLFDGAYYGDESGNRLDAPGLDSSDNLKISYYTPSFAGFSAGVSYIPRAGDDSNRRTERTREAGDALEAGAGYEGEFGDISVAAGVGYFVAPEDTDALSFGAKGGFAGFELGATYSMNESGNAEVDVLQVGATYSTGPWTFGGDYAVETDSPDGAGEQQGFGVGVSYALAPGVSVGASGEYHDADVDGVDESIAVGTWLGLSF